MGLVSGIRDQILGIPVWLSGIRDWGSGIWGALEAYATVRGGNSWPSSQSLQSPRATFLNNLSSLVHTLQCLSWSEWCRWSQRQELRPRRPAAIRGGDSWPSSCSRPSPRATFLNLSSLCPYFEVSILERVVPLITEAVVEATAAGNYERQKFPATQPISVLTQSHLS